MVTREQALKAYHKVIDKEFFGDKPYFRQRLKYARMTMDHLARNGEYGFADALFRKIVASEKMHAAYISFTANSKTKLTYNAS